MVMLRACLRTLLFVLCFILQSIRGTFEQLKEPGVLKAWLVKLVSIPILALIYWIVVAEGLRLMHPVFGTPLSKLPVPGFGLFARYQATYRFDLGHIAAMGIFMCSMILWVLIMKDLFVKNERPDEEPSTRFIRQRILRTLGLSMLGGDLVLFFVGVSQSVGGVLGGGMEIFPSLVLTVVYGSSIVFLAYLFVSLRYS